MDMMLLIKEELFKPTELPRMQTVVELPLSTKQ